MLAGLRAAEGDADAAARLWGASDGLLDSMGGSLVPSIGWIRDRYFEPVKTSLGVDSFEAARAAGHEMPLVHAIALARHTSA